jgi:iduronate 2-sulfatase
MVPTANPSRLLLTSLVLPVLCPGATSRGGAAETRRNISVLYIVVDDLRIDLPVYGQSQVHAPNLAQLAREGLVFDSAYCNQPVCSPSRNSFMSGRRPSTTKIWNFHGSFRGEGPAWITLPGHFLRHGFLTLGTGKLYHVGYNFRPSPACCHPAPALSMQL